MKIAIEARALSASRGVRSYVRQLISALLAQHAQDSLVIGYDRVEQQGTFPNSQEVIVPLHHELLLPLWLRRITRKLQSFSPDVLHFTKAAVPSGVHIPAVVTIYDVIPLLFPQGQTLLRRAYWRKELIRAAQRAQHIITISDTSRRDIERLLGVAAEKITVTPLAVDTDFFYRRTDAKILTQKYGIEYPYLISVGTLEPRKNFELLIRAYARCVPHLPHHLLLVGKKGMAAGGIMRTIATHNLQDRVHWLSDVPDADIPYLLSQAELFVFPSVYEGWGLPPLEAMACGTPVLVSDGGALPEVVQKAARCLPFSTPELTERLHDTVFEDALAANMNSLLTSPIELQRLGRAGQQQAKVRNWDGVAETTRRVYATVAEKGL